MAIRISKKQLHFIGEADPIQELALFLLGSVPQFERSMIKEPQRGGIAKAKENVVYKERVKSVDEGGIGVAIASFP